MKLQIEIAGMVLVLLALLHGIFPKYFGWKKELAGLSLLTRQMHYVHTFFIALTVLLMGLLALTQAEELAATPLGRRVSGGIAFFWFLRLLVQFFGYSPENWKGKRLETAVHIVFVLLWSWLAAIFALVAGTKPA